MGTANSSHQDILLRCKACGEQNRIDPFRASRQAFNVQCGHCQQRLLQQKKKTLHCLLPQHYQHPLDARARYMLSKVPGVDTVLNMLLKDGLVRYQMLFMKQNAIECSADHLKHYYNMLSQVVAIFGLKSNIRLYITQHADPNAYTFGSGNDHYIVLTTALIDLLEDDELESVLAHEVAHIHCGHVLYKTAARILSTIALELSAKFFGLASSILYPVFYSLLYWDRASELSADRAELLINQDFLTSVSVLMKIAGGSPKLNRHLDAEKFLVQAKQTEELTENKFLEKIYHIIQESTSEHHFPTWRARELELWAYNPLLYHILAGDNQALIFPKDTEVPISEWNIGSFIQEIKKFLS